MFSLVSPRIRQRSSFSLPAKLVPALGVLLLVLVGSGCSFIEIPLAAPDSAVDSQSAPSRTSNTLQPLPSATLPPLPTQPWGEVQRSFSFEYLCDPYSITLPLYQSSYQYFQSLDRNYYYRGELPEDWPAQFYLNFLSSSADREVISDLIDAVREAVGQEGDGLVVALTSLVQSLTYDCDKLFSFVELDGEGFQTYFPYETLYASSGVCGDTSILLGKILQELGYGAAYLLYEDSNHMALGIQCPQEVATYLKDQKGYCYIETTGPTRIGIRPSLLGGEEFTEDPVIIPIAEGASFELMISLAEEMELETIRYGKKMLEMATCQEIQLYREIVVRRAAMGSYGTQLQGLKQDMEEAVQTYQDEMAIFQSMGCQGTLPKEKYEECLDQQAVVQAAYDGYALLVEDFNQVVGENNAELNRLNEAILAFNSLLDTTNQDCGLVFSEPIDVEGEGD